MGVLSMLSCFSKSSSDPNPTLMSGKPPSSIVNELCHQFSLAEIQSAITRNPNEFSKLGQPGGFKNLFKGYLLNSNIPVAIKRFSFGSFSEQQFSEFKNEIVLLCQLQHPNLMPLTGFCIERNELIIVYEYMTNGSLLDHLHHVNHDSLSWKRRLQICIGVARVLHYLHTGAKQPVIHRHIKTSNILLDDQWEPKVSGFSLSKRVHLSISKSLIRVESDIRGTFGYIDPEYARTGVLTEKSDVFSFGVVLLEVVSTRTMQKERLYRQIHSMRSYAEEIVDPVLKSKIDPDCWKTFVDITERCLSEDGRERPDMGEVELELEHALQLQEEADAKIIGSKYFDRI
ncbi:hypothetical protein PIB30_022619 [Stylosanthes scabra]|uniref:Protein kinase domain-containing protein n=1 Tax=Stylosanthes scabra TaxID=79078 RepID=A0ABU6S8Q1_9FABA|nr:hypothetical protein [Stylosanthes scabra]